MTRQDFIAKATRSEEKRLGIPSGWWGTYFDVRGPFVRVRFSRSCWIVRHRNRIVSRHDSRAFAIAKARKLAS